MTAKRAAIYCRISEDREGRELGVTRQEDDGHALAERLGLDVVEVYRDNDISASTKSRAKRPDYRRMLADAQSNKFEVIIAYTSGRLTRRPREAEDLIDLAVQYGVSYAYVRSPSFDLNTAQGRRIARTLAAQDAGEAEEIAERVSRAKLQAATDGKFRGGPRPYGYDADGVTVRPAEAAVVEEAAKMVLAGASMRSVAAMLNGRGERTSTGKPWRSDTIREVLLRPRNAGLIGNEHEVIGKALWPAVLDEGTWRAVRAVLTDPSRRKNAGAVRRWLGSGVYLCGVCNDGTTMTSSVGPRSREYAKPAYTCRTAKHLTRVAEPLDDFVSEAVIDRLSRDDAVELLQTTSVDNVTPLYTEQLALRERLDELAVLFADSAIDARQMREGSERLRAKLTAVEERIAEASRGSALDGLVGITREGWDALDLDRKVAAIATLMTVTVLPSGRGRPAGYRPGTSYFRPETISVEWRK